MHKCDICGSNNYKEIYKLGMFISEQVVSVCKVCGMVRLIPAWDDNKCAEYYKESYYENRVPAPCIDNRRAINVFNDLAPYVRLEEKILDIGCGTGDLLTTFQDNGYRLLSGVDPSTVCYDKFSDYGITYYNMALTRFAEINRTNYDCVILSHTLEHIPEPRKALALIRGLMSPKGLLYIIVPNIYNATRPYSQFAPAHTHYYSRKTLEALLTVCGFKLGRYYENSAGISLISTKNAKQYPHYLYDSGTASEYKRLVSHLRKDRIDCTRVSLRGVAMWVIGKLITGLYSEDKRYLAYRGVINKLCKAGELKHD